MRWLRARELFQGACTDAARVGSVRQMGRERLPVGAFDADAGRFRGLVFIEVRVHMETRERAQDKRWVLTGPRTQRIQARDREPCQEDR